MTKLTRQRGVTFVGISLTLLVLIVLALIITSTALRYGSMAIRTASLQRLQNDSFIAMQSYFYDYVNSNSRCYTDAPPPINLVQLVVKGMIDPVYLEENFYDVNGIRYTYLPHASTGQITEMEITIPISSFDARELFRMPHTFAVSADEIRFRKKFNRNVSNLVIQNTTRNFCQG
ncbi:hypothetical protein VTH8203_00839 [Vibrio thalassae]|uniref:Type 4 fimbrial biogenesis protein PilX N-terminal domain-containing protein n=1 Tax=Vibrio thalassae TaxID=1243014 RepID=A0A240EEX0_9VIBR|nr:hypothetical protein [Vibrio thalassae]SNX47238.1 hypothetical protein VTH8203_00839 [Vibrio thalassae]